MLGAEVVHKTRNDPVDGGMMPIKQSRDLCHGTALLPVIPHLLFLILCVVNPRPVLHLQHLLDL
jgi:hypothetical protein